MTVAACKPGLVGTRRLLQNRLSAAQLAELGTALLQVARRPPAAHLFAGRRVPPAVLAPLLSAWQLRRLEDCGVVDDLGDGLESPFCLHLVEGLVILTDPDVPDEEQAPTYLDPLWEAKTLSRLLVRGHVERALDVGVGSGVLSLVMSRYAERVVGVDLNPRALEVARFNAALNRVDRLRLVAGDLLRPLAHQRFSRIVFNSPTDHEEGACRGLLMAGEGILERFFADLPGHLAEGGYAQVNLAMNDYPGSSFAHRLAGWLGDTMAWLQLLLLVLESRSLPGGRVWRRGWLTCRPGPAGWLQSSECRYDCLPGSLSPRAASDLIVWFLDDRARREAARRASEQRSAAGLDRNHERGSR